MPVADVVGCDREMAAVTQQFLRVTGLLDPPAALLRPTVTLRVLTGNLRLHSTRAIPAASPATPALTGTGHTAPLPPGSSAAARSA